MYGELDILKTGTDAINKQVNTILIVLAVVVSLIILFIVGKKIAARLFGTDEVKNSDIKTRDLTLNESDYRQMAAAIKEAVDGWGEDAETVYRQLEKLNTLSDYYKLIEVYGVDSDDFTFTSRMIYELYDSQMKKVNSIISKFGASI